MRTIRSQIAFSCQYRTGVGIVPGGLRGPSMAQVKKEAVRDAILAAALRLFRKQGYIETTLNAIAAAAKASRANIYVYFPSKFALFYAVFDPWLQERLAVLERELARIADPRARLRRIL